MSTVAQLKGHAKDLRRDILEMAHLAKGPAHPGPSLSCADILAALYFDVMNVDPAHPDAPDRDRLLLSKGHAAPALYAALGLTGYFPRDWYADLRGLHSRLQGHPAFPKPPGVDMTSGSLGNGLSIAAGMALSLGLRQSPATVFCIMGDGELQEGLIWEAALYAGAKGLDNLVGIVDNNGFQSCGATNGILPLGDIAGKFRAFGWKAEMADGHDMAQVTAALRAAKKRQGMPVAIIANTTKGKGVSFMENNNAWHQHALDDTDYALALGELSEKAAPKENRHG